MVGDFAGAERELQPTVGGAAVSADLLALSGRIEAGLGHQVKARASLNRALALNPAQPEALEALIDLDIAQGNAANAQERLAQLLRTSGTTVQTQLVSARVYAALRDSAKQETALRQALTIDATDPRPTVRLAELLMTLGRQPESEQVLQSTLKARPDDEGVGSALAAHYARTGRTDQAKPLYQRLVGRYPDVVSYKYKLASLMVDSGDNLDAALTFASDARKQAPADPEAADVLGWVYVGKNLPSLAVPHLTDAVKMAPGRALFHYHLGFAYVRLARTTEAEAELETSLKLDPKFDQAEKARATLEQLRRSRRS
jgi:Flp pilus assembly protein TadD